jgi:DNA repair exonuclease SbcCD ATPase subunit
MKPLSESLTELASRVKRMEDSADAARERNRAALQSRRTELETTIEREGKELEQTTSEIRGAAEHWWSDTKASIERQIEAMRADFEQWQAGGRHEHRDRAVQSAEDAAAAAIVLAGYCVDAAEWAAVRAGLVRGEDETHTTTTELP